MRCRASSPFVAAFPAALALGCGAPAPARHVAAEQRAAPVDVVAVHGEASPFAGSTAVACAALALDARQPIPTDTPVQRDWYARQLRAMREAPLCPAPSGAVVYRFLWLRTFHHPVVVRVESRGDSATLTAKRLSGYGGYDPGTIAATRDLSLTAQQWGELQRLLTRARFGFSRQRETWGLDGAQWILEGVRGDRYVADDRWSPEPNGGDAAFREACLYLLRLAGMAEGPIY